MVAPMLADLYFGYDDWKVFFTCIVITGFFGGALIISNSGIGIHMRPREGFLLINSCWLTLAVFASLPFILCSLKMSVTDAFFESMSGLTTTGATVIEGLNYTPAGILLWRAILQWLGGIGIIIMAVSILPLLRVGGMQMFSYASVEDDKASPRTISLVYSLSALYLLFTMICALGYMLSGLEVFDAVAHAMTTISTGGFSTFDQSFAYFDNSGSEVVAIIFMTIGALPFVLCLKAFKGNLQPLAKDKQVHWFFGIMLVAIAITIFIEIYRFDVPFGRALRQGTFDIISIMTGTGFSSGNSEIWGGFLQTIFFFLMMVGGCAGSTTAGIKIFRLQILYAVIVTQIKKLTYPNGVFIPYYNGHPIPKNVPTSVMSFLFVYAITYALLALALSFVGLDFVTALSGAASSISNSGSAIGDVIGYGHTYKFLPDSAKWILCTGMYLGRLELFCVLILMSPHFWRH